ncbi:MAG TPA: F0F1 ATP synthase subunit gamma [Gammaproteobacteria bacterium]|nr:F0F1 ATP synthase subunit gamma [Xanthomonadales bacterium]MCB1594749.1 F0F1 ATP synthase subunit gamma [Xanthomonadales bacterium]HOP21902.1 F0F1 ATP synthase subunit gamma [Gammaproteobacteria bacterium]HPI96256.1 F0F1 ATP synthase subunit gamma [Gammaproteobacteria bacterium]HPQ87140.1 F0F1 ATP synthase subunit gamma [Gammaproteobacteria bacterium]
MAVGSEIVTKIKSVQSTKKVTSALEMVSASKIKRAKDQMMEARPYATQMKKIIGHMAHASPEYRHPFMKEREVKRVGYIIISTDRGLCGGLNTNLFKKTVADMKQWKDKGVDVDAVTIGNKASTFFKSVDVSLKASISSLGDNPELTKLVGVVKVMLDLFTEEKIDRINLVFNDFVNSIVQKPTVQQLLPLEATDDDGVKNNFDYLYEPEAKDVLEFVLGRYVESLVFQGILENLASEHAARMIAMKNATDNASELIKDLRLVYNKARQAAITQEISEIVGGAAAV